MPASMASPAANGIVANSRSQLMPDAASTSTAGRLAQYQGLLERGQPDVSRFVADIGGLPLPELVALLRIDQRCRLERGLPAPAEDYLAAFSELRGDPELLVEL